MKNIENLNDLLIEQARELYSTENQELEVLPKFEKQVSSPELKEVINMQIEKAKEQRERIEKVFEQLEVTPVGEFSEPFGALVNKGNQLIHRSADSEVKDAGIINSIQQFNHYKIAGYGTISTYAKELGKEEVATLLHESLTEEKRCCSELTDLATVGNINRKAINPVLS